MNKRSGCYVGRGLTSALGRAATAARHRRRAHLAALEVAPHFPFADYMHQRMASYAVLCSEVLQILPRGSQLLDFGSGPCDKTAVLQLLGYKCAAFDDLQDSWHLRGDNARKIKQFAAARGIDFCQGDGDLRSLPWPDSTFDMVTMFAVLEHFHHSPRSTLEVIRRLLKPGGLLLITVPSAVNVRKRVAVVRGRTNYPPYAQFFESPVWRGHVREYVRDDLCQLARLMGLAVLDLRSIHQMLDKVPPWCRLAYRGAMSIAPGGRDSWLLLARRPSSCP